MGGCNCYCVRRINCKSVALVIAILFGVAIGILGFFGIIVPTLAGFVALGIGLIALAVLLFAALSDNGNQRGCLCRNLIQLLTGIIGTIIFAIVTIVLCFFIGPFTIALLIGIMAFFFALMIGTFVCYILCLANCRYQECE